MSEGQETRSRWHPRNHLSYQRAVYFSGVLWGFGMGVSGLLAYEWGGAWWLVPAAFVANAVHTWREVE